MHGDHFVPGLHIPDDIVEATLRLQLGIPEHNPEKATAHLNKGVVFFSEGNFDQALVEFSKALVYEPNNALYPKEALFYQVLGTSYANIGNYDQGLLNFNTSIKLNPKSHVALIGRASVFLAKGMYDETIADCDRALKLDPTDSGGQHTENACPFIKK